MVTFANLLIAASIVAAVSSMVLARICYVLVRKAKRVFVLVILACSMLLIAVWVTFVCLNFGRSSTDASAQAWIKAAVVIPPIVVVLIMVCMYVTLTSSSPED